MHRYISTGREDAVTIAYTTVLHVTGSATVRAAIERFILGASGTLGDHLIMWALMRHTTAPTSTVVVPEKLDPADVAARATAGENATAEPTYTAASELFDHGVHMRATHPWIAAPGGELIIPAIANNGLGFRVKHASYTGAVEVTAQHKE